jgi:hypothetical protein
MTADLAYAASFINDKDKIKHSDLPGVLSLFAEFVLYRNIRHTAYHHPIYEAVPSIIVSFAEGSCIDSGFCLVH